MSEQNLIDRLTSQVKGDRDLALRILRRRGHVEELSEELTAEGRRRDQLGAEGRAIDRAVTTKGGRHTDYSYNPETNRVKRRR